MEADAVAPRFAACRSPSAEPTRRVRLGHTRGDVEPREGVVGASDARPSVGSAQGRLRVIPDSRSAVRRAHPGGMSEHTTHIPTTNVSKRSRSDRMVAGVSGGLGALLRRQPGALPRRVRRAHAARRRRDPDLRGRGARDPDEGREESIATRALRDRRDRPWRLIGLGLVTSRRRRSSRTRTLATATSWVLSCVAGGAVLWLTAARPAGAAARDGGRRGRDARPPATPAAPAARRAASRRRRRVPRPRRSSPRRGRRRRVPRRTSATAIGDRTTPSPRPAARDYKLGVGDARLDLCELALPAGKTHVNASLGIGHLLVTVPQGVAVRVDSHARGRRRRARQRRRRPQRRRQRRRAGDRGSCSTPTSAPARSRWNAPYDDRDGAPPLRAERGRPRVAGVCAGIAEAIDVDRRSSGSSSRCSRSQAARGSRSTPRSGSTRGARLARGRRRPLRRARCCSTRSGSRTAPCSAIALIAVGLALALAARRRAPARRAALLAGLVLAAPARVLLLARGGTPSALLAPGAVAGALLLIAGPWLWQLAPSATPSAAARIRSEERAEVAARVHDSVLQTLALVQRHADEPRRVAVARPPAGARAARLALRRPAARRRRRHARRGALGRGRARSRSCTASASSSRARATAPSTSVGAVVLAAREAMANAAKFSGAEEISVYAEVARRRVAVFVRDRGAGFDRAAVPADRRGLAESIEGRMERAGGTRDRRVDARRGHRGRADASRGAPS